MAESDRKELDRFYQEVNDNLGGSGIEVELDDQEFTLALDEAMRTYNAMSTNSVKKGFIFVNLDGGKQEYQLPDDIDDVRDIRRARTGLVLGRAFEPFSAAFIQTMFNSTGNQMGMNSATNLVSYEAVAQYQSQVGRMFGEFVPYTYFKSTNILRIFTLPKSQEILALEVSTRKSREELFGDLVAYRWLRSYTEAHAKCILGEKYSKVSTLPSAQGGMTLKDLKTDGKQMKKDLEQDLLDFVDGGESAMPFVG